MPSKSNATLNALSQSGYHHLAAALQEQCLKTNSPILMRLQKLLEEALSPHQFSEQEFDKNIVLIKEAIQVNFLGCYVDSFIMEERKGLFTITPKDALEKVVKQFQQSAHDSEILIDNTIPIKKHHIHSQMLARAGQLSVLCERALTHALVALSAAIHDSGPLVAKHEKIFIKAGSAMARMHKNSHEKWNAFFKKACGDDRYAIHEKTTDNQLRIIFTQIKNDQKLHATLLKEIEIRASFGQSLKPTKQ